MNGTPETFYLRTDDGVFIAYQVAGDGPVDVAFGFNYNEGNVDLMWEEPDWRPFLLAAAEFARVILHDRRATGVSSRNVAPPNLETQASDFLAVLEAVGSMRPTLVGATPGGQMHALFAATYPDRVKNLVWNNPVARTAWAPDYPWGAGPDDFQKSIALSAAWGTAEYGRQLADWREAQRKGVLSNDLGSIEHNRKRLNAYARIVRNTASPDVADEINRIDWETDIRAILPTVHVPTALISGKEDDLAEAEYVASLMPNATLHVLEGRSGVAVEPITEIIRNMAGVARPATALDTVLATILFTDIVDSTAKQAALGDRAWKALVVAHHALVRESLARWRGHENDTAGDGFYATFDGPARAIRCALEVVQSVGNLGLEVRAGVHTGECEVIEGKAAGLTVSIGARVAAQAGASEVLVSQTVKDLVAGSGFSFSDVGERHLKGLPNSWRMYRVET